MNSPRELPIALQVNNVSKAFGGVKALSGVNLTVRSGEVHGLLGQNGSGKSTLVKILTSVQPADSGEVHLFGKRLNLPAKAPQHVGIAVVHQDVGLNDTMTVFENTEAAVNYGTWSLLPINKRREQARLEELKEQFHISIDLEAVVGDLTPAERTMVGILRAMRVLRDHDANAVLILDEPTSSLSAPDARQVTDLMKRVADSGTGVVFISHRLAEVLEVCDSVTVFKDGQVMLTQATGEMTQTDITDAMLGRRMEAFYPARSQHAPGELLLDISHLRAGTRLKDLTMQVHAGEIIGVTGLTGMGQELLPSILNADLPFEGGTVLVRNKDPLAKKPLGTIKQGISVVPGNRPRDGGWLDATATENITLPVLSNLAKLGVLQPSKEAAYVAPLMNSLEVRPNDPKKRMSNFSGGNQQKLVMAKWLQTQPQILVLDEPTQGVDAGAKHEILSLIADVAAKGGSVIVVSGDHEQLAHICHRVLVLQDGKVATEIGIDQLSEAAIIQACNLT